MPFRIRPLLRLSRQWLSTRGLPDRLSSAMLPASLPSPNVHQKLSWIQKPRTCLVLKKPQSSHTTEALCKTLAFLKERGIQVIVERAVAQELSLHSQVFTIDKEDEIAEYARTVDFGITLGGDGTMLHYSSLFQQEVPPVISFSLGTLGFLLPFDFSKHEAALDKLINGQLSVLHRMRLTASIVSKDKDKHEVPSHERTTEFQAMNEAMIHRGREAHLATIDCYSGDTFLTDAKADGLIVSTPTGSTAYSLSAGGPIVHPSVDAFLLTPICPQSLSFRSVLLPPELHLRFQMAKESRGTGDVSVDGRSIGNLSQGDLLLIKKSPFPIPCFTQLEGGADWTENINAILKWNQSFSGIRRS